MEIHRNLNSFTPLASSVITIGSYDGIHRGHFHIINRLLSIANSTKAQSVVITFNPHPRHVINSKNDKIKLLMSLDRKIEIFKKLGIDTLIILEFNEDFMKVKAEDFMNNVLIKYFNPNYIVAGSNHSFGFNREGDSQFLMRFCDENKIGLEVVDPIVDGKTTISSTNIRKLIERGYVRRANYELGSIYGFSAKVIHGSGRGKGLSFPTANLKPLEKKQLLPRNGVYFTMCIINGLNHYGMCNFGTRPTFEEDELVLEVHLFNGYSENLYDCNIWIEFLERIRSEKKFSSVKKLTEQLKIDKSKCLLLKDKYELGE
ncbi:MAG: riboflavin biosynthesis protein RibF [Candidatus Marinimicrobia bacterium]|nr:riboflavin biosynthesis protein RibF [Candidatus Neomarinimicrobiota bacterium]